MARILIIDDDPVMREFLSTVLETVGHEVTVAGDGWEAMKQFRPYEHQLVITDVCMPQIGGADLLRVLRREVPIMPVIAITGKTSIKTDEGHASPVEVMTGLGANSVLVKPFTATALLDAVDAALVQ